MMPFSNYVVTTTFNVPSDSLTARASKSFLASVKNHNFEEVSKECLEMWIVDMTLEGLGQSTRKRYFSRMSTLYCEWKQIAGENPFESMRKNAGMDYESGYLEASNNLALVKGLLSKGRECADRELIDIFLYMLYNVGTSFDDIIELKFGNRLADNPQTYDLIDEVKRTAGNRSYVFGLNRNNKRITQVRRELVSGLFRMLTQAGMKFETGFSDDSITAIWMAAAIKHGMPFAEIRAMVDRVPLGYDVFRLIKPAELNAKQRASALKRTAGSINRKATYWYVMKMRAGQTPDAIRSRIKAADQDTYDRMLFYYPTRKVVKKNPHGRPIRRDVPYLPSVMFFKVGCDRVMSLMHQIGDAAWCYKETNASDSPYCRISHEEMKKFQRHIGHFSPDIRMELVTLDEPLQVGTEVLISGGGMMEGHIGRIQSVRNADGTRTYTLALSEKEYARWTVRDIDEIFIEPTSGKI